MPRCLSCGEHAGDNPILDIYLCSDCQGTWCDDCGTTTATCPHCQSRRVQAVTLTEDGYL